MVTIIKMNQQSTKISKPKNQDNDPATQITHSCSSEYEPKQLCQNCKIRKYKDLISLGSQNQKQQKYEAAISYFREAIKLDPKKRKAYTQLGQLFERINSPQEITCYRQLTAAVPNDYYGYFKLAHALLRHKQKYTEIIECLGKALDRNPKNSLAYGFLGCIVGQNDGDFREGIIWLQFAVEISSKNPILHRFLGCAYSRFGWYQKANESLKKAGELNPGNSQILFELGANQMAKRQFQQAEKHLNRAIQISPYQQYYFYLGIVYEKLNKWTQAKQCYFKAIEAQPEYSYAYHRLAFIYQNEDESKEALHYYNKTTAIKPQSSYAYHDLSQFHRKIGNTQDAISCFQKAIQLSLAHASDFLGSNHQLSHISCYAHLSYLKKGEISRLYQKSKKHFEIAKSLLEEKKVDEGFQCFELALEESEKIRRMFRMIQHWALRYLIDEQIRQEK